MDWHKAIVQVTSIDKETPKGWGTGFLAAPGQVLTALHVVADVSNEKPIFYDSVTLKFQGAGSEHVLISQPLKVTDYNKQEDWAVVECVTPANLIPLPLVRRVQTKLWRTAGYPAATDGKWFEIDGAITTENGRLPSNDTPALQLFSEHIAAGQGFQPQGLSGAPVVLERKAFGAPRGGEHVVVGIIRWAIATKPAPGATPQPFRVEAGSVFATRTSDILDKCSELTCYDSWRTWLGRLPRRLPLGICQVAKSMLFRQVPLGLVILLLLGLLVAVLPIIAWGWPEEWAFRKAYPEKPQEHKSHFAEEAFRKPAFNNLDPAIQERSLLDYWKIWTREKRLPLTTRYLVIESSAFDGAYYEFDRRLDAYFLDDQNQERPLQIDIAVAFLVDKTRNEAHNTPLPRYRQQLVFVDVANTDNPTARRPPSIHVEPPSKGETLLLLLRVSDTSALPAESSAFRVRLSPIVSSTPSTQGSSP